MDPGESAQRLLKALRLIERRRDAKPFRPYLVKMAGGQSFTVKHPDNLKWSPGGIWTFYDVEAPQAVEIHLVEELVPVLNGSNPMATIEQVRNAMHAVPFQPFTVHLVDGRSYLVRHPDFNLHPPPLNRSSQAVFDVTYYRGKRKRDRSGFIPHAAMREISSNCWELTVISVFSPSAWVVGRPSRVCSIRIDRT